MTNISYWPDDLIIKISGHAGAGEKGEDLVCAAVSALATTIEQVFLVQDQMQGHIAKIPETATITAWVPKCSPLLAQAFVVMETVATGLAAIAEQFPEFVSFEIIGEERDNGDHV